MANFGKSLEAAISRIASKQLKPALNELRAGLRKVQRALDKQRRVLATRGAGARGGGKSRQDDGPTMSPKEVTALRKRLGMNQAQFARTAGVTHVSVYFWESGKTKPRGERLARLRELEAQAGKKSAPRRAAKSPGGRKAAPRKAVRRARKD